MYIVIRQAESSDAVRCTQGPEEQILRAEAEATPADLELCRSRHPVHYYGDAGSHPAQLCTQVVHTQTAQEIRSAVDALLVPRCERLPTEAYSCTGRTQDNFRCRQRI